MSDLPSARRLARALVRVGRGAGLPAVALITNMSAPLGSTIGNALETARSHDPLSTEGQVEISCRLQIRGAILDSLGVCLFIRPAFVKDPSLSARLLNARYGWKWAYRDVRAMGLDCLRTEGEFNRLAGVSEAQCDVPEFMRTEPLPPHDSVFDIPKEVMDKIWDVRLAEDIF